MNHELKCKLHAIFIMSKNLTVFSHMQKLNRKLLNIYRVLSFSLFLFPFIFTLEICARVDDWFNYNAPILAKYTSECLREYDAEGIRHNIPFVRFEKWRINNMGFRGEDIDLHAEKNKIKVVCMGASETFGLYETENNEWPAQLGRLLGDKYCVINASVVGQFLENWQKYLAKYIMNVAPGAIPFSGTINDSPSISSNIKY